MPRTRTFVISIGIAVLASIVYLGIVSYSVLITSPAMPPALEIQNHTHLYPGYAGDAPGGFGLNPPPLPPARPNPLGIMRIGWGVMESKILRRMDPIYPEIITRRRVSVNVTIEATLDEAGNVTDAQILRGHPFFNEAALEAVKKWKFSPTLVNNTPVKVVTTITLPFKN